MYTLRRQIADLSKCLKDERQEHTNPYASKRVKMRQNVSNRLKARQMCVDPNAISKKPPLLIAQDTQ